METEKTKETDEKQRELLLVEKVQKQSFSIDGLKPIIVRNLTKGVFICAVLGGAVSAFVHFDWKFDISTQFSGRCNSNIETQVDSKTAVSKLKRTKSPPPVSPKSR